MSYEKILIDACQRGINVKELKMYPNLKGIYNDNKIIINSDCLNETEKKCILSEEIGHHETSFGNILNYENIASKKQEEKARRWAYDYLISLEDLVNAFEYGATSSYDIAQFLNITESFLEGCIKYFKKRYGISVELKKYHIFFEPYLTIHKKQSLSEYLYLHNL